MHVDEWLDTPIYTNAAEAYAKFVIEYYRLPAWKHYAFNKWMGQFQLFCTYEGVRYRVTGASRLGDIYLTPNFNQDAGYTKRVDVSLCSNWSNQGNIC